MEIVVEVLKRNRQEGARLLLMEYRDRLFKVAFRICGNASMAEDLVLGTLVRAVDKIDSFDGKGGFFQWLYAILMNFLKMELRRKGANALDFQSEVPEVPDESPDAAETLSIAEDSALLRMAIARLPAPFRAVIVFRYFEDMSVPEIAKVIGISEGTVKSRLNRAKYAIRRILQGTIASNSTSQSIKQEN